MSFFFVSGFGSGAYSAKLFAGTRQRLSGFSRPRQCGDDVLRMLVTGGPPVLGGGGMPQRIMVSSRCVAHDRRWIVREDAGHRRRVANVSIDDPEQRDDGGLVGGDRIRIAHAASRNTGRAERR